MSAPPFLVDLDHWHNGTERQRSKLARDMDLHLRQTGTFLVAGHQIEQQVFEGLRDSSRHYFDSRAASGVASERFAFGPIEVNDLSMPAAYPDWYPPITWPTTPDDFQAASELFWRESKALADVLLQLFALAIELPQSAMVDQCRDTTARGSLHRLCSTAEMDLRGTFTILDLPTGGLDLVDDLGTIDPASDQRTLVVAVGDMLQRWTNDRWHAGELRVTRNAPGDADPIMLAFAHAPDADAVIAPFSTCVSSERPSRYEPLLVLDFPVDTTDVTPGAS